MIQPTLTEYAKQVDEVLSAQRKYFTLRNKVNTAQKNELLDHSKRLEQELFETTRNILKSRDAIQPDIFQNGIHA